MQDKLKDRNAKMLVKLAKHPRSVKRAYDYCEGKVFTKYGCIYDLTLEQAIAVIAITKERGN